MYGDWGINTQSPMSSCSPVEMLLGELLEGRTGPKQLKRDPVFLFLPLAAAIGVVEELLETTGKRHRHRKG